MKKDLKELEEMGGNLLSLLCQAYKKQREISPLRGYLFLLSLASVIPLCYGMTWLGL